MSDRSVKRIGSARLFSVVTFETDRRAGEPVEFQAFAPDAEQRLRRALVARYGVEAGADATSEALAYAWEHWPEVSEMSNPIGYLYRVAQTRVQRHHRWKRRAPILPRETAPEISASEPALPVALRRLRPDVRVAVVLIHGYAWSYAEVAALLDVPVTTVRNHVHRGTARLRNELEK
jgi:RNA polymerase sigma factor (sigma-70 family)